MSKYRGLDTEPGWVNRRFKDLDKQVRELRSALKLGNSSLPGQRITIRELLQSPTATENGDYTIVTGPGDEPFPLSHVPIRSTLIVWWRGRRLPDTFVSVDGNLATVADPDGRFRGGDRLSAYYDYLVGDDTDTPVPPITTLIPFEADGWRHLQVALTDTDDYSGAAFDDSGWALGACKFGNMGDSTTAWAVNTSMWLRKTFPAATDVTITVPVEDWCEVFVNGVLVGSVPEVGIGPSHLSPPFVCTVPPEVLVAAPGSNVLAVRAYDETATASGDNVSVDVQVVGRLL